MKPLAIRFREGKKLPWSGEELHCAKVVVNLNCLIYFIQFTRQTNFLKGSTPSKVKFLSWKPNKTVQSKFLVRQLSCKLKSFGTLHIIMIKFGYNACWNWLKERALEEYRAWSWAEAVTPSAKLYYVRPFRDFSLAFFR